MMCGMTRVRVSTTVDGDVLAELRSLLGVTDSELFDRAMRQLLDHVEGIAECAALAAAPYEHDPDLAWSVPISPLAYDGDVPPDVLALAEARRQVLRRRQV
jgi:hypothetical protein